MEKKQRAQKNNQNFALYNPQDFVDFAANGVYNKQSGTYIATSEEQKTIEE